MSEALKQVFVPSAVFLETPGFECPKTDRSAPASKTATSTERPEAQLLLACARTNIERGTAELIKCLVRRDLDWEYFLNKTYQHHLTQLIFRSLSSICPEEVPKNVLDELRERANHNARHNLYRTGELMKLLRLFESEGIPALPFKGPTLSLFAYGSLGLREYGDLDVLVSKRHVLQAKRVLHTQGYRLASLQERSFCHSDVSPLAKDLIFDSEDGRVRVELHWQLMEPHFGLPLDLDLLAGRVQRTQLAGTTVLTLAPEALLLYLCMHGSRHWWSRLQWVCDVAELIETHQAMGWESAFEEARKLGCERMLALGLSLATELLGTKLPKEVWQRVGAHSAVSSLTAQVRRSQFKEGGVSGAFLQPYNVPLTVRERVGDRIRLRFHYYRSYFRRALVPNEWDHAMMSLPALLSPLYYLLRPIRLLRGFNQEKLGQVSGNSEQREMQGLHKISPLRRSNK